MERCPRPTHLVRVAGLSIKKRNYDILAAVFTDVLKNMHDDFGLV
jgi:hypothetical protein